MHQNPIHIGTFTSKIIPISYTKAIPTGSITKQDGDAINKLGFGPPNKWGQDSLELGLRWGHKEEKVTRSYYMVWLSVILVSL